LSEQKINNKKNQLLSWIIFLPTLVIILFTLILGMFPALIIALSDKARFPVEISAFEPGVWMFPILISNTIIFAIIILYRKNRLPQLLTNLFRSFLNFEISQRTSLVLIGVLISSYAILNAGGELYAPDPWEDFEAAVEEPLQNWSFDKLKLSTVALKFLFGYMSMELFGSYRVIPFVASLVCLFLTYLVTVQISKKRFAGIVALAIVLQSLNL